MRLASKDISHKHIKIPAELDLAVENKIAKLKKKYKIDFSKLVRDLLEKWVNEPSNERIK